MVAEAEAAVGGIVTAPCVLAHAAAGRRMMSGSARRFLERGIHSFILFAELSNPTLRF